MPRKATGNVYCSAGRWYARVKLGENNRPSIALPTCTTERQAIARKDVLAALATKLRAAPHVAQDVARGLLERAAQRDGKALTAVVEAVDMVCRAHPGDLPAVGPAGLSLSPSMSFQAFATLWTSGELAKRYPDHVRRKRSVSDDVYRLEAHVYPIAGAVPVESFQLDDAERVMRSLPSARAANTRRHVAQLIGRVMSLAVFPARLITASPIPKGFLPKLGAAKAMAYLYPDEDGRLMACRAVPLCFRVLYGFLNREGLRASEAAGLTFGDLDLERGAIRLDVNKTDEPRAWGLGPDVVRALKAWRALRGNPPADALVFIDTVGRAINVDRGAERFRGHLRAAGVDRAELFERSDARQPIRIHDARACFITVNLANGRSETWIADRTGHRSSIMINRYRRAARTFSELGLGQLAPLDTAIPELSPSGGGKGAGKGGDGESAASGSARNSGNHRVVHEGGLEPPSLPAPEPKTDRTAAMGRGSPESPGLLDVPTVRTPPAAAPSAPSGDPTALSPEPEAADRDGKPTRRSPRTMTDERSVPERAPLAAPVEVVQAPRPTAASARPPDAPPAGGPVGSSAALVEQITGAIHTAAACGDLDTARALHAALARALGVAQPHEASGPRVVPLRGRGKRGAQ